MDHVVHSPAAFYSTRPFKNALLLHFSLALAWLGEHQSAIIFHFISLFFPPSNHVSYNNWNRRRNGNERKRLYNLNTLVLFFSLLRLSTATEAGWMSTLSSTKHSAQLQTFFLIMTKAAAEARYCPTCLRRSHQMCNRISRHGFFAKHNKQHQRGVFAREFAFTLFPCRPSVLTAITTLLDFTRREDCSRKGHSYAL